MFHITHLLDDTALKCLQVHGALWLVLHASSLGVTFVWAPWSLLIFLWVWCPFICAKLTAGFHFREPRHLAAHCGWDHLEPPYPPFPQGSAGQAPPPPCLSSAPCPQSSYPSLECSTLIPTPTPGSVVLNGRGCLAFLYGDIFSFPKKRIKL